MSAFGRLIASAALNSEPTQHQPRLRSLPWRPTAAFLGPTQRADVDAAFQSSPSQSRSVMEPPDPEKGLEKGPAGSDETITNSTELPEPSAVKDAEIADPPSPTESQGSIDTSGEEEERDPSHDSASRPQLHSRPSSIISTSIVSRANAVIPRSRRRGLFGRFAILPEVKEPYIDYLPKTKWTITFIVSLAAAAAPMGSSVFFPSLPEISADLHTTPTITNLSVALYMLAMSIFPLWWSSFSETFGRRTIYLASFTLFMVFSILAAISTTMAMLIVMRLLIGGAGASVQAVGAGTVSDIWEVRERGKAMGIFYLGPLCGPLFGPIIGGAVAEKWGWRATHWFLAIYGGVILISIFFCLPETLDARKTAAAKASKGAVKKTKSQSEKNPVQGEAALTRTSTRQSVKETTNQYAKVLQRYLIDPLRIILYLRFPPVLLTVYYASITFGSLYILNVSIQSTFSSSPYNFSVIIVGLLYIPNSLGYVLASIFGGRWIDYIMQREAKAAERYDDQGRLIFRPEDRMRENAWIAAFLYPAALVWYGWTAEKGVFWLAPMIANFFFGIGSMLVFAMVTTMLTEFMPGHSSHGVALNNFVRNIFSCVGSIIAQPVIDAIGNGWLFTIVGALALLSCPVIWAMRRYASKWRETMDKALKEME